MQTKALLLSNSTMPGTPFFTWPRPFVQKFLEGAHNELIFIPFAAVTLSHDDYEAKVREAFSAIGFNVRSIHHYSDKKKAVAEAGAIIVGGGNSFALLHRIQESGLLETVREQVLAGKPYIGWSAGANLGCPTIMTTNDMPVVWPSSLQALNLVPFQINPHYHELKFEGQGGETRRERLEEFLEVNRSKTVIGLPEGMLLHRDGKHLTLQGTGIAKLYQHGGGVQDLKPGAQLDHLL